MPFKDTAKKKAYYHRHQKHYQKVFIDTHRKEWNEYQRDYRKNQRREIVEKIKTEAARLNIAEENSLTFKAAVVLQVIILVGITRKSAIARRTGYAREDVDTIFQNWEENGVYKEGKIEMEHCSTDLEMMIQLTLISMVGAGELIAWTTSITTAPSVYISATSST